MPISKKGSRRDLDTSASGGGGAGRGSACLVCLSSPLSRYVVPSLGTHKKVLVTSSQHTQLLSWRSQLTGGD